MQSLFPNKYDADFQELLKEDATNGALPSPGNATVGFTTAEETRTLEMINSVLSSMSETPVINPYYMVQRIRDRVALATGLTFDDAYFTGETGVITKTLFAIDFVQAHKHNPALAVTDNGFLNKFGPAGLSIKFHFLKSGGLYNVNVEIIQGPQAPSAISS